MYSNISSKEIGSRLSSIRAYRGITKESLAQKLDIPLDILEQIELGEREMKMIELQKIANFFDFSLDSFLANNFDIKKSLKQTSEMDESEGLEVKDSTFSIEKFSNTLLYILERCAGKPNVGETLIYKLLYFSDFNFYELHEEYLTGIAYKKLPYGPVPKGIQSIFKKMIDEDKSLKKIKVKYYNHTQTRYIPLKKADISTLKAIEINVINHVIEQFSDWSADNISEYSHKDIPWLVSEEGEEIDYELAFYREVPYSIRNYAE